EAAQGSLLSRIRGNIEGDQFGAEATSAICPVSNACHHPHRAQHQRLAAEIDPDEGADEKAKRRRQESAQIPALLMPQMVYEGCGIHSHEGNKSTEIQTLCADLVGTSTQAVGKELQQAGSDKRKRSYGNNVVAGNAAFRFDGAEKRLWQRIAPTHTVEERTGGPF